MTRVTLSPTRAWVSCEPGERRTAGFVIENAPATPGFLASITGGADIVRLTQVVVERRFLRPITEEEIMELPPLPPWIRERARRHSKVEEVEELGRSDGATPLLIPRDATIRLLLSAVAPIQAEPEIVDARLVVTASEWETTDAPVYVLLGRAAHMPRISPPKVGRVVEPGSASSYGVIIESSPSTTGVIAFVEGGDSAISVKNMIAYRTEHHPMTEEEIRELPPHPPSLRERARREGAVEYIEAARSAGDRPLQVDRGQLVTIDVQFAAPARNFPHAQDARLVVDSPTWHRVEIPLRMIVGLIRTELSSSSVAAPQGGRTELEVTISSIHGPATDVALGLGMGEDQWHVEPPVVHVPQGQSVRTMVSVVVASRAPVGTFTPGFETRYFEGMAFRSLPFELTVRPAAVHVRPIHDRISVVQGGSVTAHVEVRSDGGYKLFGFHTPWPPTGVSMSPVSRELGYGAVTTVIPLEFHAAPDARPVSDAYVPVYWSAGDGGNTGVCSLRLSVTLRPEERTFEQVITTPTGTALGGRVSLTIRNNGTYTYAGHMHGSGFDPYAFRISVVVRSRDGMISLAAMASGAVGGTIGGGSRDFDWIEHGPSAALAFNWSAVRDGQAEFVKWYTDNGVLGTLEDVASALAHFFVGSIFVGPHVAAAILIGRELGEMTGVPFAHPAGLVSVIIAGGAVLLLGPGILLPAMVAGIAAGSQVRTRRMRPDEIAFADTVFAGTLPIDRILIVNLARGDKAFCIPQVDGSILIGMGGDEGGVSRFDQTLEAEGTRRTFIHELTHAWQIAHGAIADVIWQAALNEPRSNEDVYRQWETKLDGRPWSSLGTEDQAQIVAYWTWLAREARLTELLLSHQPVVEPLPLTTGLALNHKAFPYIQHHIRMGQA